MSDLTTERLQFLCLSQAFKSPENQAVVNDLITFLGKYLSYNHIPMWAGVAAFVALTETVRLGAIAEGVGNVEQAN